MKRTRNIVLLSLAVIISLATSAMAQQPRKAAAPYKKNPVRVTRRSERAGQTSKNITYTPRVKGRSTNFVIEGRITSLEDNVITIKTSRGARYDLTLDDQTTVLDSGELVSIATMADIALSASDLRVSDTVEIVAERVGQQEVAKIITRIASSGAQVAKR
jgi:hypothetical protein